MFVPGKENLSTLTPTPHRIVTFASFRSCFHYSPIVHNCADFYFISPPPKQIIKKDQTKTQTEKISHRTKNKIKNKTPLGLFGTKTKLTTDKTTTPKRVDSQKKKDGFSGASPQPAAATTTTTSGCCNISPNRLSPTTPSPSPSSCDTAIGGGVGGYSSRVVDAQRSGV